MLKNIAETATISDLTRCTLALIMGVAVAFVVINQIEAPNWFIGLAGLVFGGYFALEKLRDPQQPGGGANGGVGGA